jgi:hypothetical protein
MHYQVRCLIQIQIQRLARTRSIQHPRVTQEAGELSLMTLILSLSIKAITGGVVPAFSTFGAGDETHLPARESSWSLLRHKFISRSLALVYSDSAIIRDFDPWVDRVQHLAAEASTSPPFLSPSSSSDSSASSKYSSDSPSLSPTTSSPPSFGLSPASSNLPQALVPSSRSPLSQSSNVGASKPSGLESIRSPSKTSSIAERRGFTLPRYRRGLRRRAY